MALFENLTARLSRTVDTLRGRGRITEENVGESLREVRMALLEADVALPVVKTFIERVKQKALGAEVTASLTPRPGFRRHPAQGTGRHHGRRAAALRAARAAAGGRVVSRPAGRGQDHHRGQAGALAHRVPQETRVVSQHGYPPPGRRAAAAAARGAGGRGILPDATANTSRRTSRATRSMRRARAFTTCSSSTPRAACTSTPSSWKR